MSYPPRYFNPYIKDAVYTFRILLEYNQPQPTSRWTFSTIEIITQGSTLGSYNTLLISIMCYGINNYLYTF